MGGRGLGGAALVAVATACWPSTAIAQQISPMVIELSTASPGNSQTISYRNTATSSAAIETHISRRTYDAEGMETDVASEDVEISPSAFWVEPGHSQTVQVVYRGPSSLDRSAMYVIAFREVPLAMPKATTETGVTVRMEFRAIAQIIPPQAEPRIVIGEQRRAANGTLSIRIENLGTKYARFDGGSLSVFGDERAQPIPGRDLLVDNAPVWLLPGESRWVKLSPERYAWASEDRLDFRWTENPVP